MKKYLLLLAGAFVFSNYYAQKEDPVLMYVDGAPVLKSEFLQIYLKNNNDPKYDKASLDEYMELFKKFKLKVAEAEALGYDTIPKLKKELDGYRKQLSVPYLIDSAKNQQLVREAYDRTKNEVRASHILIRLEPNASPADTLKAWNRIMALKKRIENGEDFATVAREKGGSEDPSVAQNGGDLGYFNAFQMVYPFEDAAYNTPVGTVSKPIRTRFGYHIIKVTDKRASRGSIQTAHIMIAIRSTAPKEELEAARKKADEIYAELQNGADWNDMVKKYSDDPGSMSRGGLLPVFGTGTNTRMVPEFESAAFALKNDGDISKPIQTEYGFHIIKRVEKYDVKSFEDLKKELQNKVNRDERSKKTQDSFVEKLKKEYKFKDKSKKGLKWFEENLDSTYFMGKWDKTLPSDKFLFSIENQAYGQKDFAEYLKANFRSVPKNDIDEVVKAQYRNFQKEKILEYEESQLDRKYPEFKALMQEYHDGILLYEVMTDKIWNKAIEDTTGLKNYFEAHRDNYMFGDRYDAVVYEVYNDSTAQEVFKMIQNDTINSRHVLDEINKDSELNLTVRTNKFEIESTPFLKGTNLQKGVNKPFMYEGKYYVVKVNEKIPPTRKELSETKGAVTSDYQAELEQQWLEELRKKHTVKVNEDVLYSLGK